MDKAVLGYRGSAMNQESYAPEDCWVEARYPLTREQEHEDRATWPWLPGWLTGLTAGSRPEGDDDRPAG